MKKILYVLMVLWMTTPAWAQRPTPIISGGSTSTGDYNPPLRVSSTGVLYISLLGSATTPIQRPSPTIIGGADSNGLPIALLTDSDGTLRVSCSDCGGGSFASGTAPAPSINGTSFTTTGLFWAAGPVLGVSVDGVERGRWSTTAYTSTISYIGTSGTFSGALAANGGITSTLDDPISIALTSGSSHTISIFSSSTGTTNSSRIQIGNGSGINNSVLLRTNGTGWTTSGSNIQDGASLLTGSALLGGLTIGTIANATLGIYTQDALRLSITGAGVLTFDSTMVTPAASGVRFLCISTAGVITSGTGCVGT